nr:1-deoxy-D-xylulose-5-phosphate synthase [Candidatus Krumholzibacteria bacterium]
KDAERFHGIGSFYKTTGNSRANSKRKKYCDVFGEAMIELAERDGSVLAVTAAMTEGTGLTAFGERFPERFFDVGIAEQHAVTFAAGLARAGMKPFVAIYSTFLQRSYDQIIHDVALQKLPVKFMLDRAGLVGEDGPTHHGAFDLSYLSIVPGMVVMTPCDERELRMMMQAALEYNEGPIALRFPRGSVPETVMSKEGKIEIGRGALIREGRDAAVIAVGTMVERALMAADLAAENGVEAAVVNARFIKPIDRELILSVSAGGVPVVTVEENTVTGGFGDGVARILGEEGRGNRIMRLGLPDSFIVHGKREELLSDLGLDPDGIARKIIEASSVKIGSDDGGLT